jgi:hypothetical protein
MNKKIIIYLVISIVLITILIFTSIFLINFFKKDPNNINNSNVGENANNLINDSSLLEDLNLNNNSVEENGLNMSPDGKIVYGGYNDEDLVVTPLLPGTRDKKVRDKN